MNEVRVTSLTMPSGCSRAPRVAMLVYNDATNDSRVLKTAASLRSAGAQVRIFAVARARAGHVEGLGSVGEGIAVCRAPEFELARYAIGRVVLSVARGVLRRPLRTAQPGPGASSPPPPDLSEAGWIGVLRGAALDLWLRAYRSVSLGLYWMHTVRSSTRWRPDVVHANDGNTLAPALCVARTTGAAIVYDSHELWLHRNVRRDRPVAPWVEAATEQHAIRRAAGVITVSPSIAAWLQQRYALTQLPALVRNAPVTLSEDDRSLGRRRLRHLAGLGEREQVIAYGGRITTGRGIEETLHALAVLPETVHLVLLGYGEPDYLARLHTVIDRLGLTRRVHFVGAVRPDDVSATLADADICVVVVRPVCLSYAFSLPNKLFESIHAGVPVVVADLPDMAAVVRTYGVGEVLASDEPAVMAQTLQAVLADPARYRDAARRAATVLSWEHEQAALLTLYSEVLAGAHRDMPRPR